MAAHNQTSYPDGSIQPHSAAKHTFPQYMPCKSSQPPYMYYKTQRILRRIVPYPVQRELLNLRTKLMYSSDATISHDPSHLNCA